MARVVVIGSGIAGLSTSMLLARDGHDVAVLERDPASPPATPEAIWSTWERRGVNQFRMLHYFLPRFRAVLESALPEVPATLESFGAFRSNPIATAPDQLTGGTRPGDQDFETLTGRRPVIEAAMATAAVATPGVEVRRGVAVRALTTGAPARPGIPHVIGIETEDGEQVAADLVVDATGRRSNLPARVTDAGGRPPIEESEDCGFVYYGRHFRSADGAIPPNLGPLLQHYGTVSVLTLPADNGTWACAIVASAKDAPMRALRDVTRWEAMWRSFPLVAHWLDGEPISDGVATMAKIEDRHRSFCIDDDPVVTGIVAVGDAWACTNPSVGRGTSIGMLHAVALRDHVREAPLDDPVAFARVWHETTDRVVEPWYRATLDYDRRRLGEIDAELGGETYESEDPAYGIGKALEVAAMTDPEALRAYLRVAGMLALPADAVAAPGVFDTVLAVGDSWRDAEIPAPTRAGLLEILGA